MSTIDESLFKSHIKDGSPLKCSICLGLQQDPHRLPCAHVFCGACLGSLIASNQARCPLDRQDFSKEVMVPERLLSSIIDELDVICCHHLKGCNWEGEHGHSFSHLKNDCLFEEVPCLACKKKVVRIHMDDHMEKECQAKLPCPYACYGCKESMAAAQIERHKQDGIFAHFDLVVKRLQAKEKENEELEKLVEVLQNAKESVPDRGSNQVQDNAILQGVINAIDGAINGTNGSSGGARLYDNGHHAVCYQLYKSTAEEWMKQGIQSGQQGAFWMKILFKGDQIAAQKQSNWGSTNDAAWVMRRAFEAVKEGAHMRGAAPPTTFWRSFKDKEDFRPLATMP